MSDAGNARSDVLIFSEDADAFAELVTAARGIVAPAGGRVVAVAIGVAGDLVRRCAELGADEVLTVGPLSNEAPGVEGLSAALREAVGTADPHTILIAGTRTGAEIAASLAQTLETPCASDCMALRLDEEGNLAVERRVYGGRFVARQTLVGLPHVATVPPKRFARAERREGRRCPVRELAAMPPPPRVRVRAVAPRSRSAVDITKAEIIVAAGRGVKRLEDLALVEKLAAALDGVVAGSRPLTGDLDWLPVDRRVGLSGQTIKPNLYIACGISGQIEHIVGMKAARTVVAINNDPKAPIHAEADYSLVGDLYELVPALAEACARARRR